MKRQTKQKSKESQASYTASIIEATTTATGSCEVRKEEKEASDGQN